MAVALPASVLRLLRCGVPFVFALAAQAAETETDARVLAMEGVKAHEAKDEATFLAKMEAAVALRPDYPRMLVNLAAAQLANEHPDDAIATLERLAALGVHSPVEKSADFTALRGKKEFDAVVKKLSDNLDPKGKGEIAFSLPEVTGLIEGMAWREKTDEFFFGDVHLRAVWVRSKDKKVRRFSEENDALLGVFGLAVDEDHGALWAATSAVSAMRGYVDDQKAVGGLAELDLETGNVKRVVLVPADGKDHAIGDLVIAPDGSVFGSDSAAHTIWRLAPNGNELERWLEVPELESPQGLVIADDGRTLYVADYVFGLFRIDVGTRAIRRVAVPANTTLLGIDALVRAPDGTLLAVQNGVRPMRVLRLTLESPDSISQVDVLESAHLTMAAPALGCIAKGEFFFVGNSGWSRFEVAEPKPTAPRPVPIFHTKL